MASFAKRRTVSIPGTFTYPSSGFAPLPLSTWFTQSYTVDKALNRAGLPAQHGDFVASIPTHFGAFAPMTASLLDAPVTETMKYVNRLGGLVTLANEEGFCFAKQPEPLDFPMEIHFTGLLTVLFFFEAYLNIGGVYFGEIGGSLRTDNNNNASNLYSGLSLPLRRPSHVRLVLYADRTLELFIDNVSHGIRSSAFTLRPVTEKPAQLGFGTTANNSEWFVSSYHYVNRLLTPAEAAAAHQALKARYSTGLLMPYPTGRNNAVSGTATTVTSSFTYVANPLTGAPEDVSKRRVRWYGAGNGGGPFYTGNLHVPSLDGLSSWQKNAFPAEYAAHTWFRTETDLTDTNNCTFGASVAGDTYFQV